MRKQIIQLFILLYSFYSFADDKTIKIAISEYPPYEYLGKDDKIEGIDVDTITESFKLKGYKVEFIMVPWLRAVYMTNQGLVDGIASVIHSPDHDRDFLASDPISYAQNYFFKKKTLQIDPKDINDLSQYNIGLIKGFPYGDKFNQANLPNKQPLISNSPIKDNLYKLNEGRIDLIVCEIRACTYFIEKYPELFSNINYLESVQADDVSPYYLGFSRANMQRSELLLKDFNDGLSQYVKSGARAANIKKYNLKLVSSNE